MVQIPLEISALLSLTIERGASDLHVSGGQNAVIRKNGTLIEVKDQVISNQIIENFIDGSLNSEAKTRFWEHGDVDFAISFQQTERFRVNAFKQSGHLALAIRHLNSRIPSMEELRLPQVIRSWPNKGTGLVIVTGPTGSGKSTTVASLVNEANQTQPVHVLTIEDPVEYVIPEGLGIVRQREIGHDSSDFARAVRSGLREDIDIMVIGEMRDRETISSAITVAETGHLVFATLHTSSAAMAVDRIIDAFEAAEQPLIRSRLSSCLVGVVYQRLLPSENLGRAAAYEVLVGTSAVRNLIREGKTHHIPNVMTTAKNEGMQLISDSVHDLEMAGLVSKQDAAEFIEANLKNR